ncbi:hypothetical protein ACH5RR_008112 [Cinchona calisaya]|uniref:SLC26A/SulP transporter domain-containing protein n=1 Tax=Cinchona calisaya TaxID=153742 RepID=A0ABD3AE30_9GENT
MFLADSSFVPPLVYSVLGSSRHLAVGPVSIASLVMGAMLNEAVSCTDEPILYLQLAFTATFFAGLFQASLGLLSIRKPELFWISAACPLASVILSTILVVLFTSKLGGIQTMQEEIEIRQTAVFSYGVHSRFGYIIFQLVLANPVGSVMEKLHQSNIL